MVKHLLPALLLAAFILADTQPGVAADVWRAKSSGSFVTLSYGPLDEREKPVFFLSCLNGVNIAVLSVFMDFDETEAGLPLNIELSAGEKSAPIGGDTASDEATGAIYGDFGDIAVTPVLKVLREKGPVTITSGDSRAELPEIGRAAAVAEFSKDCTLD